MTADKRLSISDLYHELSSEQQAEVALYLSQYVDLICRIYEQSQNLTEVDQAATI